MKLLSSFQKELVLASRSFYFYIEVLFAVIMLAVLLFAIPEQIRSVADEYVFLNMPQPAAERVIDLMLNDDVDGQYENVTLTSGGEKYEAILIGKEESDGYLLDSEETVRTLADRERNIGAVVSLGSDNELHYIYYLQGYETQKLKNLISVLHNEESKVLEARFDQQPVRVLSTAEQPLNDKENAIPPMLAFNSCLMGMFIMSAYVFLDKKEGVIRAYAVTASSVKRYLMSKILVVLLTGAISSLIVSMPILGFDVNYALLLALQLTSGFFASALGLLIASFYRDIEKAFGVIFAAMILMMLPGLSHFLPGWNPLWVKLIPSHPIIQGFREIILSNGNAAYVLLSAAVFLAVGTLLFFFTEARFRKTLGV